MHQLLRPELSALPPPLPHNRPLQSLQTMQVQQRDYRLPALPPPRPYKMSPPSPTNTGRTRKGLQAERAVAVESGRWMAHSHEESPRDLVQDFSQTRHQPEEQVSLPDQDTPDRGSAIIPDSLPGSTAYSQEESPGILFQDFRQKKSQLEDSSPTILGPFLGQTAHDREGATTSNPLPGSMLVQSQEKSRTIQGSFPGQATHDRGSAKTPDSLPCLTLTHSKEESSRDLTPKFDQKEDQLEEFLAIQDAILGQATHDQGGATTPDSLPGQSELPRAPRPESGLLTSSFSQLNVSYLVPQVRNPTYSLSPLSGLIRSSQQDDPAEPQIPPKTPSPPTSSLVGGRLPWTLVLISTYSFFPHSEFTPLSQKDPFTESLATSKTQATPKTPDSPVLPPAQIPRPSSLPQHSTNPMDPPGAKDMLASGFSQERNQGKGKRSLSRRPQSRDSARKPIRGASGESNVRAAGETTVHGKVAGSVEANAATFPSTGPSAAPDDSGSDVTENMISRLEVEFPYARDYSIKTPTSKTEINRKRDELEEYCTMQRTVKESKPEYTLYNTLEYYQLIRLTLWVAKNKHQHESTKFPPNYLPGIRLTEDDIRRPRE